MTVEQLEAFLLFRYSFSYTTNKQHKQDKEAQLPDKLKLLVI